MASDPVLKITNVSRTFGAIQALKEANFEINEGEIMGLVGENGAGTVSYTHLTLPTILLV